MAKSTPETGAVAGLYDLALSELAQLKAISLQLAILTIQSVMTVDENGFPSVNKGRDTAEKKGTSMGWLPECLKALAVLEALTPKGEPLPICIEYDEDGREAVCWTYSLPGLTDSEVEEAEAEAVRYAAVHAFRRAKSTKRGRKPRATLDSLRSR